MRFFALVACALLAWAVPAAAKAKAARTPTVTPGRLLFARAIKHGRRITGPMVAHAELPPDRPYKEYAGITAALDSSWCAAYLSAPADGTNYPTRVIDRGCTGTVATSTFDWRGLPDDQQEPVTQRRLDDIYEAMYDDLDAKLRRE